LLIFNKIFGIENKFKIFILNSIGLNSVKL
jgi:hypothetical protein